MLTVQIVSTTTLKTDDTHEYTYMQTISSSFEEKKN